MSSLHIKATTILADLDEAVDLLLELGMASDARSIEGIRRSIATDLNVRLGSLFDEAKP